MSANAALTIVGGPTRIEPGRETTLTAQIVNLGTIPDDFRLSVREIDPAWVTFRPPTVFLQPGAQANAAIVIAPPSGIPAGALRPIFRLLSRRAGNVAIVEIAMPTARSATPPPDQAPARPQTTPPPRQRPTPPPAPAATPPIAPTTTPAQASAPIPTPPAVPPAVVTGTRAEGAEPNPQPVIAPAPTQDGLTARAPQRATMTVPPGIAPRRAVSPLALALGGGLLALLLIVGVAAAFLARGNGGFNTGPATGPAIGPTRESAPTATSPALAATATIPIAASPIATRTPTVVFVSKRFIVANTGGDGVYLRRTTNLEDRDTAYADGTALVQVGPDVQANGLTWRNVRTPDGRVGYIPAQYTQEAP